MALGRAMGGGVIGGLAGAGLMLPVFVAAKHTGLLRSMPPTRVVEEAAASAAEATELGGPVDAGATEAAVGSHLLYGAAAGAFYGLAQDELALPPGLAGVSFGLLLWVAGYLGWLPATGLMPWPWRQRAGAAAVPIVAHLLYGLTLGLTERAVRRG